MNKIDLAGLGFTRGRKSATSFAFALGLPCCSAKAAHWATPITLVNNTINMFRDIRGANDVGIQQGDVFQFGANIVGGSTGTTLRALYPSAPAFAQAVAANCQPLTVNPNFCGRTTATSNVLGSSPQRLNPWTLEFKNGTDVLQVAGPSLVGTATPVPFPVNVTISGSGLTPTISWTIPNSFTPNGFRAQIFDRRDILPNGQSNIIQSVVLAANATSYTFLAGDLKFGGQYTINLQVIETRLNEATPDPTDRLPFTGNEAILVRSSSFFDFSP